MQDTLRDRISNGKGLTQQEAEELAAILGSHCRESTKQRIARELACVPGIENFGIYGRIHLENGGASYCAGQSYRDEIRTVRKLLIG